MSRFFNPIFLLLVIFNCGCGYFYYEVADLNPPPQLSPPLKAMIYLSTGKCNDNSLMFSFLQGTGIIFEFDSLAETQIRTAEIKFFLKENWTYEATYVEYFGSTLTGTQTLVGQYSESNLEVSFGDLGTGTIVEIGQKLHLVFKFARDILTPGLINKEIPLRITLSPFGIESKKDYCATHVD